MAEKRMFTTKIVDSDPFKEMPLSAQALYFHLGMNADDEGFLNNAKSVQRSILASDDDMKLLIAKNFIIPFESGVVVIKHWKMHNTIQPSRLKPTQYNEEKALLTIKENKSYTLNLNTVDKMSTDCQQIDNICCPRVDKSRLEEISVEECSVVVDEPPTPPTPSPNDIYKTLVGRYGKTFVDERVERAKKYNGCNMETVKKWCEEDFKAKKKNNFNNFPQRDYDVEEIEKMLLRQTNIPKTVNDVP